MNERVKELIRAKIRERIQRLQELLEAGEEEETWMYKICQQFDCVECPLFALNLCTAPFLEERK